MENLKKYKKSEKIKNTKKWDIQKVQKNKKREKYKKIWKRRKKCAIDENLANKHHGSKNRISSKMVKTW